MKFIVIILMTFALLACSSKTESTAEIAGTYVDLKGKVAFEFTKDGKVRSTSPYGKEIETTYVLADHTLSFKFPDGLPMEFTIASDGSLSAPAFGRFIKR